MQDDLGHRVTGVIGMIEQLILFILQDALFMLGYLSRGNVFPKPLERKEEAELIERMGNGDGEAREKLITHNLRLCAHIARKYTISGYDQDDLISIGTIGLIKGVNTYKFGSGTQLSTYCARCIENAILSQMRLWFRTNPPRAEKHQNGVLWHRFPRISTSFAPLRRAM